MSEFVLRKNVMFFYHLDFDGDGVVELSDFKSSANVIADKLRYKPGSPEAARVSNALTKVWDTYWAPADTDADGAVSLMEFLGARQANAGEMEAFGIRHNETQNAFVEALDSDGDGKITKDEFSAWVCAMGDTPEGAARAFSVLDQDGDGKLDAAQYSALVLEYHTSPDPKAPGNYAHGSF